MSTMRANQLKTGVFVLYKGQPHAVVKCEFYFPGKGSAFARTRMKNVKNGNVYEYTFKSAEMVETVDVDTVELQYLYKDGDTYYFMNPRTFDQFEVAQSIFEGKDKYLMPEMKMFFNFYEGEAIGVRFPLKVTAKVIESEDTTGGNTVNAPKKPVKIETGVEVMAPLFIKQGETIIVDTETDEYVSRA